MWQVRSILCHRVWKHIGPEPDDQFRVDDCHECLRKTDPRVEREFDDDSYRNPHQEKVPMFRNKYYTAPNNRVAELLELYTNGIFACLCVCFLFLFMCFHLHALIDSFFQASK